MNQPTTVVLAISRQFASGGAFIGRAVAQRLGLRYADREILHRAAEMSGAKLEDVEASEERVGSFWAAALRQYSLGTPEAPFVTPLPPPVYERDLFDLESRIIREIASRVDAVIVGRGGFHVLADHPGLVSVRVHAAEDWRVRRAMSLYGLASEKDARELIRRSDLERGKFIRTFTGKEWDDASSHHLCVDTGAIGLDLAAELVVTLVAARIRTRDAAARVAPDGVPSA